MTERDLAQKLDLRHAFWAMGASTRIDVKLSALVPRSTSKTRAGMEEWTDLDVLAVEYSPLIGTSLAVADCKTLKGRVTERVFWLRGVADLFGARAAFLTRDEPLPASSRQLALRLGISALDPVDRSAMIEQLGDARLPQSGNFLSGTAYENWTRAFTDTPKAVERLERYRRSSYWVASQHRNLTFLPTRIDEVAKSFAFGPRWALIALVDLAWLYLLALLRAIDDANRMHLAEPARGLEQAVAGSEQDLREKRFLAERLARILQALPGADRQPIEVLPPYFDALVDVAVRISRRRAAAGEALRVLEFVGVETLANRGATWEQAFPDSAPYAPKIAADLVRFLVRAAGLDPRFASSFEESLGAVNLPVSDPIDPGGVEPRDPGDAVEPGVAMFPPEAFDQVSKS